MKVRYIKMFGIPYYTRVSKRFPWSKWKIERNAIGQVEVYCYVDGHFVNLTHINDRKERVIETSLQEILEAVERIRSLVPKDEDVLASLDDICSNVKSLQK